MSRVLWWLPEYPPDPGGIGTFASHVAPALAEAGHDVTMLIAWGEAAEGQLGERLTYVREPFRETLEAQDPLRTIRLQSRTRAIKQQARAELYHVHLCEPTPFLHVATTDTEPGPTVLTLHNEVLRGFEPDNADTLIHRLFSMSSVVTVVSAAATRYFAGRAPRFSHRLVTIPNGAPVTTAPAPYPHRLHIAAIGRLVHQKGFDRLLRAMPLVVEHVPDVHLHLLGDGPEGPTLAAAVETLGLTGHVTMHGHVARSTVAEHIAASRFVVAPSRFEGLPYAALETAGQARALVATRVAGTEDVVDDGTTGLLLDHEELDHDPRALATAIVDLLLDPRRAEAMGAAGRDRVQRLFSLEACAESYMHVYRAALEPMHDVAVVIPVHNGGRHLRAAIDAALADIEASGLDAQVIVVDDGSTDGSAEIARRYRQRGVEVFTQPQLGTGLARNAGIALTNSTWVAHLDADDTWPIGRLRALLAAADDDNEAVFGRGVEFADDDAPSNARVDTSPRPVRMLTAGIVRRSAHDRIGGFDPDPNNDLVEWTSRALADNLRYTQIDDVTLRRRIHATNKSHSRPFATDTSRISLIKQHLERRRANDQP